MAKKQIKTITDTILFFTIQLHMKKYEGTYVIKGVEKKNNEKQTPYTIKKVKIRCFLEPGPYFDWGGPKHTEPHTWHIWQGVTT